MGQVGWQDSGMVLSNFVSPWKKWINTETSKSVLLFDTLCFFYLSEMEIRYNTKVESFSNKRNLYSSLLLPSTPEKLPLDPDYIPHLKKVPFSLSCSLHF